MSELLPSELARLILGYIELKGYKKTAEVMLSELPELAEINQRRRKGRKVNLRVGELRLTDFLDDYYATKDLISEYMEKWPATFSYLKKIQPLADHVKIILEMAIKSKTYKFYPKNHYRSENDSLVSKMINPPLNLPHNITVTVGDYTETDCISDKRYNIDTTPESSLPGSVKRLNNSHKEPERTSVEKNQESGLSTPDPTPQKRKGSLRKKNQPSPKALSKPVFPAEGDEKMEKLIKNLIENKALHQKIAENINKTLYSSNGCPGDDPEASLSLPNELHSKHAESSSYHDLDFNVASSVPADPVLEGDVSFGSKASLSDNVISNLSLQVTNDPMVESILASLDCGTQTTSSNNRALTTPVPPLSPSHSSHLSLSCSAFASFQPCASTTDMLSQPLNQVTSNFALERCLQDQHKSVKPTLKAERQEANKEMVPPPFPVSFTSVRAQVLNKGADTSFICNTNNSETDSLDTPSCDSSEQATAPSSLQNNCFGVTAAENGETSRPVGISAGTDEEVGKVGKQVPFAGTSQSSTISEMEQLIFFKSNETPHNQPDISENAGLAAMNKLLNEAMEGSDLQKASLLTVSDSVGRQSDGQSGNDDQDNAPKRLDGRVKSIICSNRSAGLLDARSDVDKDSPSNGQAEDKTSVAATQCLWSGTPQPSAFMSSGLCQNFSPARPPSVRAVPITNSNDAFVNSKYFSGTPDQTENYTFTELTPLAPVVHRQELDHHIVNPIPCVQDALPTKNLDIVLAHEPIPVQPEIPSESALNILLSNNISEIPSIAQSQQGVVPTGKVITEEYLGSKILKVSGQNDETSVVVVQMPYQDLTLPLILPKSMKTLNEQRSEEKKIKFKRPVRKRSRKQKSRNAKGSCPKSNLKESHEKRKNESVYETHSSARIKEILAEAFENSSKKDQPTEKNTHEGESVKKRPKFLRRKKSETKGSRRKFNLNSKRKAEESIMNITSQSDSDNKKCQAKSSLNEAVERTPAEIHDVSVNKSKVEKSPRSCSLSPPETGSLLLNQPSEANNALLNQLPETDVVLLNKNVDMETLIDELENRNIDDISVIKNSLSFGSPVNEPEKSKNCTYDPKYTSDSVSESVTKPLSPQLRSLISFSKSFILKSNLGKSVNSPSSTKIPTYKGSFSTPRNKRNHVRALDFSTPRKGLSPRKRSPGARANLKFSSPWFMKQRLVAGQRNKASTQKGKITGIQKQNFLTTILEDTKEGRDPTLDETKGNNSSLVQDPRLCEETTKPKSTISVDKALVMEVEEDLFLSEDESPPPLVIPSADEPETNLGTPIGPKQGKDASSLRTPGKGSSFICLEAATPTPILSKGSSTHEASLVSELNTPVVPTVPVTQDKSPFLKAYPQGPYSDSSEGTYYQRSEMSVTESLSYSPLQDDIESVLIRTAQETEREMAESLAQGPQILTEADKEEKENTEATKSQNSEEIEMNNPAFNDLLKNRPKYKLRKLTNKQLGEIVEQEMDLFKKMKKLVAQTANSNADETEDEIIISGKEPSSRMKKNSNSRKREKESEPQMEDETKVQLPHLTSQNKKDKIKFRTDNASKWLEVSDCPPKVSSAKKQSLITFESFRCELEVLKTFTIAVLRNSHIESARSMLDPLLAIFVKAKVHPSTFSEKETIELLLKIVNFYAPPDMANKLKNRAFALARRKTEVLVGNAAPSTTSKTRPFGESSTKTKAKSISKMVENVRPPQKRPEAKKMNIAENTVKIKNDSPTHISVVECEIEQVVIIEHKSPSNQTKEEATAAFPVKNYLQVQGSENQPFSSLLINGELTEVASDKTASVNKLSQHEPPASKSEKEHTRLAESRIENTSSKQHSDLSFEKERSEVSCGMKDSLATIVSAATSTKSGASETCNGCYYPRRLQGTSFSDHVQASVLSNKMEVDSPSERCARTVEISPSPVGKSLRPVEEFGCVINITPRKKQNAQRRRSQRLKKSVEALCSPENSRCSFVEVLEDKVPPQHPSSPIEDLHNTNDDYSCIERQLAALDGSVVNSPALREKLLSNTLDEENISAIFTPSSRHSEEMAGQLPSEDSKELLSYETPKKKLHKPLISFTPLPGTPEKAMEEICQTVVKDKVALVAFPSLMQEVLNEDLDKELSRRVQDVSKKLLADKEEGYGSELMLNEENHHGQHTHQNETQTGIQPYLSICDTDCERESYIDYGADDNDDDTICTLSFSDTFDFLSLNLDVSTRRNGPKRLRAQEKNENNDRRKVQRLGNSTEAAVDKTEKSRSPSSDLEVLGTQTTWQVNGEIPFRISLTESEIGPKACSKKENQMGNCGKRDNTAGSPRQLGDDGNECLGKLQLSSSEFGGNEDDSSSNSSTTERLSSGARGVTKGLVEGGIFELSESPKKLQTLVSKFPSQDIFSYFNEESMYSIPPTPGKDLFLTSSVKQTNAEEHRNREFEPLLSFPSNVNVHPVRAGDKPSKSERCFPPADISNCELSKSKLKNNDLAHAGNKEEHFMSSRPTADTSCVSKTSFGPSPLKKDKLSGMKGNSVLDTCGIPEDSKALLAQTKGMRRSSRSNKGLNPKNQRNEDRHEESVPKKRNQTPSVSKKRNLTSSPPSRKRNLTSASESKKNPKSASLSKKEKQTVISSPKNKKQTPAAIRKNENQTGSLSKKGNKTSSQSKRKYSSGSLPKKSKTYSQSKKGQTSRSLHGIRNETSPSLLKEGSKKTALSKKENRTSASVSLSPSPSHRKITKSINKLDKELEKNVTVLTKLEKQQIIEILDIIHLK